MTSDRERLWGYVETWRGAVDDVVALLRSLHDADWGRPTDLPGWDVRAVAAHLAALESELSGVKQQRVELPERDHITGPASVYTEFGVVAREQHTGAQITDELEERAAARYAQLKQDPPTDPAGDPPRTPGKIGWSWETLLSNRVVDVWMHGQDIRRAVGRPGDLESPAAAHTIGVFSQGFGYVVGKQVAPPAGTTVALEVSAPHPVQVVVEVGPDGRARPAEKPVDQPTASITLGPEEFILLSGGRRVPEQVHVRLAGDESLGRQVLAAMALTQ